MGWAVSEGSYFSSAVIKTAQGELRCLWLNGMKQALIQFLEFISNICITYIRLFKHLRNYESPNSTRDHFWSVFGTDLLFSGKNISMLSHSEAFEENLLEWKEEVWFWCNTHQMFNLLSCLLRICNSRWLLVTEHQFRRLAPWLWRCHPLHVHPGAQGAAATPASC